MEKKKIMIVDDDREFLEELKEALSSSGYDTTAVSEADKALEIAEATRPELVLLDLKMPHKSGFQLAGELKQRREFQHVPIIAMSAFYKNGDFALMEVHGIRKCLKKPLYPQDVIEEIKQALKAGT